MTGQEWILDVLADLTAFARQNGLPILAEQLGDASLVATAEIASNQKGPSASIGTYAAATEQTFGGTGAGA